MRTTHEMPTESWCIFFADVLDGQRCNLRQPWVVASMKTAGIMENIHISKKLAGIWKGEILRTNLSSLQPGDVFGRRNILGQETVAVLQYRQQMLTFGLHAASRVKSNHISNIQPFCQNVDEDIVWDDFQIYSHDLNAKLPWSLRKSPLQSTNYFVKDSTTTFFVMTAIL